MSENNYLQTELEELLQKDLSTWTFMQEGSLDGIWYWDLERPENEWMSPEFWRTMGFDPAEKRHDPAEWQDLIFQDDLDTALENFHAHCADQNHPYDQVVRYRHADGSTVWVRCRGMAIRDPAGKPIRMLGAHTDITQVKVSEESARAGWRAADKANAELRSFAYSISHDLKAPSNTLDMLLNELERHIGADLDAEGRDLLDMSQQTVGRMKDLIDYVLEYTRVIGMEPKFEDLPLNDAVDHALQNLRADIDARGARIDVEALPRIRAVRAQINILFQNLLANAIKFCPPDRTPRIHVAQAANGAPDRLKITVQDNGIGIPPGSEERIFRLFQRLHGHSEIAGAGIGLPMCQHIAMNHQGEIGLTSMPGVGSEFALHLPRHMIV